jgi:hypothetical protein
VGPDGAYTALLSHSSSDKTDLPALRGCGRRQGHGQKVWQPAALALGRLRRPPQKEKASSLREEAQTVERRFVIPCPRPPAAFSTALHRIRLRSTAFQKLNRSLLPEILTILPRLGRDSSLLSLPSRTPSREVCWCESQSSIAQMARESPSSGSRRSDRPQRFSYRPSPRSLHRKGLLLPAIT